MKEYRKIQTAQSGSAGGYTSKWELFHALSFIKDTLNNYTTQSSESFTFQVSIFVNI